jgi:hypothetical protein
MSPLPQGFQHLEVASLASDFLRIFVTPWVHEPVMILNQHLQVMLSEHRILCEPLRARVGFPLKGLIIIILF